jgi:hypothetical protein
MRHDSTGRRLGDERLKRAERSTPKHSATSAGGRTSLALAVSPRARLPLIWILPIQTHLRPPRPSQATGGPTEPTEWGWDSAHGRQHRAGSFPSHWRSGHPRRKGSRAKDI